MNIRSLPPPTRLLWLHHPMLLEDCVTALAKTRTEGWQPVDHVVCSDSDSFLLLEKEGP